MELVGAEFTTDGRIGNQVVMNLDDIGECIEIPVYPNKEKIDPEEIIRARYEEQWEK